MNEQRFQAYLELIQTLIDSPAGAEPEILNNHPELLDEGLVQTMKQVAARMAENGETNANWLQNQAAQLASAIGKPELAATPEAYFNFLIEVLQATANSNVNPQVVYPLLVANLDKLDNFFAYILRSWATATLADAELLQAQDIATVIVIFSSLMQQFPLGNRASNLEIAITGYDIALTVYTRETFPTNWAMTQNNLASAYANRIRKDRGDNLEQAIAYYQTALTIYTREAFPIDWATTQNNLASAYANRIREDRGDNLELAMACYREALTVYTREAFPTDWAMTQNNLASAYANRIREDRGDNLEQAMAYYQTALTVYTREAFPTDWAMTQNNLGIACREVGRIEDALACFRLALEIITPITNPIACLNSARSLGNTAFNAGMWAEAISGYEIAITAVEKSRTWATTDSRRQEIIADAIDVYENMVQACINTGQLDKALEYVERSRSKRLVDLMASNDLYAGGDIPPQVQEYLQQYEELQRRIDEQRDDSQSDNNRELIAAGTTSHNSRAAWEAKTKIIQQLETQKQQVWEQLRRLDPVIAGEIQVTAPDLVQMQQLIDDSHTAILSFYTTTNHTHIFILRQNQNPQLHTCTSLGQKTLRNWIFDNWLIPYLTEKTAWVNGMSQFFAEMSERLQLPNLIAKYLDGIKEVIILPHLYLHLIPFAALPVGKILPDGSQKPTVAEVFFGDKFLIRYVPSCQILQFCQQRQQLNQITYGTVEDADGTLPGASFEGNKIAELYNIPKHKRLRGSTQATVSNYRQLARAVQVLHSSHHAQSRLDNPLESKLTLADGTITLGEIMTPGWRMPNLSDVFLSCCETNLGVIEITDDILTLGTGFLCAGARNVCSSLWAVDDLATALFSIIYHQQRKSGEHRSQALKNAQTQLRTLTGETLTSNYKQDLEAHLQQQFNEAQAKLQKAKKNLKRLYEGTPDYQRWQEEYDRWDAIAQCIFRIKENLKFFCQQPLPFATPSYWAGFISSGLR